MNIIAIIPARGGSKGLPHKHVLPLANKPLIAYTIEAALQSKKINRVIVTTDDKQIADISRNYGSEVIIRSHDLSNDSTPTEPVIKHVVNLLDTSNYKPDIIVTLQPTSPLRTPQQIDDALSIILSNNVDSVIGLKEVKEHPYKMKKIENNYVIPFLQIKLRNNRRQDMPVLYKENGAIYITKYDLLMNENKLIGEYVKPFIMSDETSIDIDTLLDFKVVECLMESKKTI